MAREDRDGERKHRHRKPRHTTDESPPAPAPPPTPPVDDESARLAKFGSAFERPVDLAALREARLTAMETPATTRKKMKSEVTQEMLNKLDQPKQSKRRISEGQSKRRISEGQPKPKEKDTSRLSVLFGLGRSVSTVSAKPTKSPSKHAQSTVEDDASQYVYGRPEVIRRDFQTEADARVAKEKRRRRRSSTERREPTTQSTRRHRATRSTTEPTRPPSLSVTPPRPSVRRSRTSTTTPPSAAAAPTTTPQRARAQASSTRPAPKRSPSIFGSIFPTRPPPAPERQVSCLTCGADDVLRSRTAKLPCSHYMCHSCLKRIFKLSVKDPAHMPPRCCTQEDIDLLHVDTLFDDDFKKMWNRKYKEFTAKDKIYCPRKGCGEWIQTKHMSKVDGKKIGRCPLCKQHVCCMCNGKAHRRRECPQDPALKQLTEIAEQKGWRKCYNCSAMVELKEGCNHMTCRCTAEFCMVCGLKWKSCDCAWFSYEAAGNLGGDPVRYQQELDRRREQERRDAELARRMQDVRIGGQMNAPAEEGQAAANNAGLLARARGALAATLPNTEGAARGWFAGWLDERDRGPGPVPVDENTRQPRIPELPRQATHVEQEPRVARRRSHRVR